MSDLHAKVNKSIWNVVMELLIDMEYNTQLLFEIISGTSQTTINFVP